MVASSTVPFTLDADLGLGAFMEPWLRVSGADVTVRRGGAPTALPDPEAGGVVRPHAGRRMPRGSTIRRGGAPTALPDPEAGGVVWQHAGRRTLLRLPSGVRFLVEDGRAVRYETERGAQESDVRAALLGDVWAVLGWQRGLLPLHASSVTRGRDLHAFTGGPGMGKSTLAAALARHGYALFTDDVVLLDPASFDAGPLGHGHGALRLCRRSMALTGSRAGRPLPVRRGLPKWYAVPARSAPRRAGRLRTVHVLSYRNDCRTERWTRMNDRRCVLRDGRSHHLRQRLLDWSGHVESWRSAPFPVLVVRYEDLLADTAGQLARMTRFLGLAGAADGRRLRRAAAAADFTRLQEQEARDGFHHRLPRCRRFFRSGRSGDWRRHLSAAQALRVTRRHGAVMRACGYDPREAEC